MLSDIACPLGRAAAEIDRDPVTEARAGDAVMRNRAVALVASSRYIGMRSM
jgi:hypothetical protein